MFIILLLSNNLYSHLLLLLIALKGNILLVGMGRRGVELTRSISLIHDLPYLLDENIFAYIPNLSSTELRKHLASQRESFIGNINKYEQLIIIGDLSEKISRSSMPVLSYFAMSCGKEVYNIIIMPYRFERSILYDAMTSLNIINNYSSCIIMLDKDAVLTNNPELSDIDTAKVINSFVLKIIDLLLSFRIEFKDNLVNISDKSDINAAFKEALKMLYNSSKPDDIHDTFLYISNRNAKLRDVEELSNHMEHIFENANINIAFTDDNNGLLLITSSSNKFERYDPLYKITYNMDDNIEKITTIGDLRLPNMEL